MAAPLTIPAISALLVHHLHVLWLHVLMLLCQSLLPRGMSCGSVAKSMGIVSPHVAPYVQASPLQIRSLQAPSFHLAAPSFHLAAQAHQQRPLT